MKDSAELKRLPVQLFGEQGFRQNRTHINIHEYDILRTKISAKLT